MDETFERFLNDDQGTRKIINNRNDADLNRILFTSNRRACWRIGYETGYCPEGWAATPPFEATDDDEFYRLLGAACSPRNSDTPAPSKPKPRRDLSCRNTFYGLHRT